MRNRILQPGLLLKLALFFFVFTVPALLVLDVARTVLEFRRIAAFLDSPAMRSEIAREAAAITRHRRDRGLSGVGLERDLERWVLTLTQPRRSPFGFDAIALLEFSAQPFFARIIDANGQTLASTEPTAANPRADRDIANRANAEVTLLRQADRPRLEREFVVGLHYADQREALLLTAHIPRPSARLLRQLSFEWPVVLIDGVLFALASGVFLSAWVTRRLRRIAATADAWRLGDFQLRINDASFDEIGRLAHTLDTIPPALEELVQTRAALAGVAERERLARDLHDTVKQKAFALSMQLGALRASLPPGQREHPALDEARHLGEEIQHELAAMLSDLRPIAAADFATLLSARINTWARRAQVTASTALTAAEAVSPAFHDPLLRILDEALANVQRHSGADRIEIELSREAGQFLLRIGDNGGGGIVERGGRGLTHLRERSDALPGGYFEWHSPADGGSELRMRWHQDEET